MTVTITRTPRTRIQTRKNLVRNPRGFSATTGYSVSGGAGTATLTAVSSGGPASPNIPSYIRATWTAASTGGLSDINYGAPGDMPIVGGQPFAVSWMFRCSLAMTNPALVIRWYDATNTALTPTVIAGSAIVATAWGRVSGVATAPAGTTSATVSFRAGGTMNVGTVLDVTAVICEVAGTAGAFFDGRYGTIGSTYYSWVGLADQSTSIAQIDNPTDIFTPQLMTSLTASRSGKNTIIDIPGVSLPAVVLHPTSGRRGKMTFLLGKESAAIAFDALMQQQASFVLVDTTRAIAGLTFNLDQAGYSYDLDMKTQKWFTGEVAFVEVFG